MATSANDAPKVPGGFRGIHPNVIALGFVSLLTDVSSEMLIPVLPLFVTGALGASVATVGLIEGIAECTASVLRLGSGWLSDRAGSRKPFLLGGYGLSTLAKVGFALATSWPIVLAMRFSDRVGKGLRNPPRDALIADSTDAAQMGRAFGLHRAMDTLGAAIGPLVAFALLARAPGAYRQVFVASAIPAVLSIVVLIVFVKSKRHAASTGRSLGADVRSLGAPFRRFLLVDGVFQLGNSSMAFVLLRAKQAGFADGQVALVYFGYNLAYALLSYPLGGLSDRIGRRPLLRAGYVLYAGIYALLALPPSRVMTIVAFALLGLHSALIEGQQRSLIADLVPADRRGTAYGAYATVAGAALLPASLGAGLLWDRFGAAATFGVGAALASLAAALFVTLLPTRTEQSERHAA